MTEGIKPKIAIVSDYGWNTVPRVDLKQLAILFDQFALPHFHDSLDEEAEAEKYYLESQGLIFDAATVRSMHEPIIADSPFASLRDQYLERARREGTIPVKDKGMLAASTARKITATARFAFAQIFRQHLREKLEIEATPVFAHGLLPFSHDAHTSASDLTDVLRVVIGAFPVPKTNTPWEDIIEFRRDLQVAAMHLRFIRWARSAASGNGGLGEILEELQDLLNEYEAHMKIARIKSSRGVLETVIVTGAEIAEDLVKFKWGKLAKGLFELKHQHLALVEAEQKAPGREVALLAEARKRF